MAPYESNTLMQTRLSTRYGITATISLGDADVASDEIDQMGPFIGAKKDSTQARRFPRSINPDGTANTSSTAPEAILDAAALLAYHSGVDEGPAITSESVIDRSVTYATPKSPQAISRIASLLGPYLLKVGQRLEAYPYYNLERGDYE